jgi:putative nucleotidyltransferase with HDIG domain
MMSSNASLESAFEALRLGAQDYLLKPFENLEMVLRVVNKAIEKRRLIEENERLHREVLAKSAKLERAVKRLTLLNEIANALHSVLNLKDLLKMLVTSIAQELGAERATLMLVDPERRSLTIEASVGIDEQLAETVRVPIGTGISGWVAQQGQTLFSEDISRDPRFTKHFERPYLSDSFISAPLVLSVPIMLKQQVIGVINVNNKQGGGSFTEDDTQLVTTVAGQVAVSIENARIFEKLRHTNQALQDTHFQTIAALAEALEAKDAVTGNHSDRLLRHAEAVAATMGLDERETELLRYAAILHDIGKIGVPEAILQKPARLTAEEFARIKEHPRIGAELIRHVRFLETVAPIILAHHEWFDGSGYPAGLAGEAIPLQARIVAVLDAFDAMTSERPYRPPLPYDHAISQLREFTGSQFDPRVVAALLQVLENEQSDEVGNADETAADDAASVS